MQISLFKKSNYILSLALIVFCFTISAQEVRVIDNKGTIQQIRNNQVTVSNTAPTNPLEGDVWYDTNTSPIIVKIWDEPSGQWESIPGINSFWSLTGNSGTNASSNFIGTTDANDLVFRTNNIEALRINQVDQFVGIGSNATERLDVNGRVRIRNIETDASDQNILVTTTSGIIEQKPLLGAETNNIATLGANGGIYVSPIPTVYTGFFIIDNTTLTATGTYSQSITGLPFQPSQITFVAHTNVGSFNINDDNATGSNNTNLLENTAGTMNGYARNDSGTINQAVIYIGAHGNSINDISRYSNNAQCIGLRYTNQNGDNNGVISAALSSFDASGFTLNVTYTEGTFGNAGVRDDILDESVIILYTAYR